MAHGGTTHGWLTDDWYRILAICELQIRGPEVFVAHRNHVAVRWKDL